ncbi:hypothetical protein IMCC20628_03596 [Hoeflea sp. IMCC20628]|nr:hypothetical protein IMCC20628_03596 [Hoeflea sp. IMCC20628]
MQELQNEYKSSIRRDAAFPMPNGRTARVDGLIEGSSGPIIAEIKLVRPQVDFSRRLRDGFIQLRSYISSAREIVHPKTSGILVLVLDGHFKEDQLERIEEAVRKSQKSDISVRILKSDDLMIKYGLASPPS